LNSGNEEKQIKQKSINENLIPLENSDSFYIEVGLPTFDFVFSPDFDNQKKNLFLVNFKNNKFFNDLTLIDNIDNTTLPKYFNLTNRFLNEKQFSNALIKFNRRSLDNINAENTIENFHNMKYNTKNNINNSKEYRIVESANENIMINNYRNMTHNGINNKNYYGIIFNSTTKYVISFYNENKNNIDKSLINKEYNSDDDSNSNNNHENKSIYSLGKKDNYYHKISIVQTLIDNAIFKTLTNATDTPDIQISSKIMNKLDYSTKHKIYIFDTYIPLVLVFYFIPCTLSLLNNLVIEKESRLKESLVIIGLKRSNFWISWAITYSIIIIINSVILTLVMYIFELFVYVHWTITFPIFVIYGLTCCCISFIISTLLKNSKTTGLVGLTILISIMIMYVVRTLLENSDVLWTLNFIFAPLNFLSIVDCLGDMENDRFNITYLNVFLNKSFCVNYIALLYTFTIYFLIAIYLDTILPQGNNIRKRWHFFITDVFHNNNKKLDEEVINRNFNNPFVQNDSMNLKRAVEVCNIGKNFKVKKETQTILNNISFNAFYDEIFAILGHNGAGKTTLLNIMTGVMSATRGNVYYENIPISGNEIDICKQFGYCPQFDAFNNNMTVAEHIKLYAGIKNINVDVIEVLKKIDLVEKKDNYPSQLSGGQKRKLSIILALLGSPKFIFLDEPTTGLDPYSRKKVWELLIENKKGCVIFITTHYMDEADLLSDRKMILSDGDIACMGTSLFLKNSFNMNYSLDIQFSNKEDVGLVDEIIKNANPDSIKTKKIIKTNSKTNDDKNGSNSNESVITTYLLPMTLSKSFKDIFRELNVLIKDENNGIEKYSLTAPTLEDLFIRLENHNPSNKKLQRIMKKPTVYINVENENLLSIDNVFDRNKMKKSTAIHQISSIVKLRLKLFLKNKTFVILYTLLPLCIVFFCVNLEYFYTNKLYHALEYKPTEVGPSHYKNTQWFKSASSTGQASDIINIIEKNSKLPFVTADYPKVLTSPSDKLSPNINYIGGFEGTIKNKDLQFTLYRNSTYSFAESIAVNLLYNAILEQYNINETISVILHPFATSMQDALIISNEDPDLKKEADKIIYIVPELIKTVLEPIIITIISMFISLSISIYGPLTVKERENGITHQLFLNGAKSINYWISVLISDTICVIVPIIFISIICSFMNISIFKINIILYILFITLFWTIASLLHQYILCHFFKNYGRVSTLFLIINPTLTLIVSLSSIINSYLDFTVLNFYKELMDSFQIYYELLIWFTIIFYTPAAIAIVYMKVTTLLLNTRYKISDRELLDFLNSNEVKKIISNNNLSEGKKNSLIGKLFSEKTAARLAEIIKDSKLLYILLCILFIIVVFSVIHYFLEKSKEKRRKKNNVYSPLEREILDKKLTEGPKDVYNEWQRVKQDLDSNNLNKSIGMKIFELNKDFPISIDSIRKKKKEQKEANASLLLTHSKTSDRSTFEKMDHRIVYDETKKCYIDRVIDNITYGVNEGECLGLLGPNGAGKTTSISMITGLLSHTHGKVVYGDKDLDSTDLSDLSLGYCCQSDALWSSLTVKETIDFYLNICGYPKKNIPEYTRALIEVCGIEQHTNKRVCEISGGTKRKLSLIIAICSYPKYLILDEPSAGMDPFTRRYMWKIIKELKKTHETATVLTTHSTEEAEALCERIAILIKGRLVCLDTPKSLKMNHCNSYTLEVYTKHPKQFEAFVRKNNIFGLGPDENFELETSISYQKYFVEMKTENIPEVFSFMEKAKDKYLISQYNFGQYSLEQIFIKYINSVK